MNNIEDIIKELEARVFNTRCKDNYCEGYVDGINEAIDMLKDYLGKLD